MSFGDNLKKLPKSRVSVEKHEKKKYIVSITINTLYFMYFGLLNPNFLWKKRFGSRVSEITSKNCRKDVFLWKNLRSKKNIVSITLKTLYFMYFGLLNRNFYGKRGLKAEFRR